MTYLNRIINSDCIEGMRQLPEKAFHTCVTSPPYFGLRDYGHDGQIGLEETPEQYVQKMVEVFREVKRVLRDDGTLWLNLGDSYAGSGRGPSSSISGDHHDLSKKQKPFKGGAYKPKDLIGIPWRVAFALQADGWYLRQDIIWNKPNPMPESVRDRCTKAHEYIFLLSKSPKYFFDNAAIKTATKESSVKRLSQPNLENQTGSYTPSKVNGAMKAVGYEFANKRSVWTVTTKPFKGAHFATFPADLIEPCILAGSPKGGFVLDPFGGAATTGLVCQRLKRNYTLFELNPEYITLGEERLLNDIL
jgi:DNA modification methylase